MSMFTNKSKKWVITRKITAAKLANKNNSLSSRQLFLKTFSLKHDYCNDNTFNIKPVSNQILTG